MPSLRQLMCHLEKGPSNTPLREYNTTYGDGVVSTYVGVPSAPTPFSVHLTSQDFIAPGLAMFVFIDGIPQCNRNRSDLRPPGSGATEQDVGIDFRVRQKEVKCGDGQFVAHEWRFDKLSTSDADKIEPTTAVRKHCIGSIEVVILRCEGDVSSVVRTAPKLAHLEKKPGKKAAKNDAAKTTIPASPTKVGGSDKGSFVGGLGGLFDGANDGWSDAPGNDAWGGASTTQNAWNTPSKPEASRKADGHDARSNQSKARPSHHNGASDIPNRDRQIGSRDKDKSFVQADGAPGSAGSPTRGIVINQYMNGEKQSNDPQNQQMPAMNFRAAPQTFPYLSPWQSMYGFPYTAMPMQFMPNMPLQSEFEQFLAWKFNNGQGTAPNSPGSRLAPASSNIAKVGEGAFTPNQAQGARQDQASNTKNNRANDSGGWDNAPNNDDDKDRKDDGWDTQNDDNAKNDNTWDSPDKHDDKPDGSWNNNNDGNTNQDQGWDHDKSKKNENSGQTGNGSWGNDDKGAPANDNWANNDSSAPPATGDSSGDSKDTTQSSTSASKKDKPGNRRNSNSKIDASSTAAPVQEFDPSKPYAQPYWSDWKAYINPPPKPKEPSPPPPEPEKASKRRKIQAESSTRALIHPSPPQSPVSGSVIANAKLSHQVHPGKGAIYQHSVHRPKYIDTMERPYAVFVFKYRSNEKLEEIFGGDLKEAKVDRGSYRERLMKTKKEDIMEEYMRMKAALGADTDSSLASDFDDAKDDEDSGVSAAKSSKSLKDQGTKSSEDQAKTKSSGGWADNMKGSESGSKKQDKKETQNKKGADDWGSSANNQGNDGGWGGDSANNAKGGW